jgi:hypothetical protein
VALVLFAAIDHERGLLDNGTHATGPAREPVPVPGVNPARNGETVASVGPIV